MEKNSNEITVKVTCSNDELVKILNEKGFKKYRSFSLDDDYYIPKTIDVYATSIRGILANAVLIRHVKSKEYDRKLITYKTKIFDDNGDIISQESINCNVYNVEEAKSIFECIGYTKIMNIKEDDDVYEKDGFELAIKYINGEDILIEIETEENTEYDSIDKLKEKLNELEIPIDKNNYFVKKAEIKLSKILKR